MIYTKMTKHTHTESQRIKGTYFDEVVYADDPICIAQTAAAMNRLLAAIESEGRKYGMRINKSRCGYLAFGQPSRIRFQDGTKVPVKDEVKYIGCNLNNRGDTTREVV